jgi:hypothetical protein
VVFQQFPNLQVQQKNIMDQLGHLIQQGLNTARRNLAGGGTQTAGLAFGGDAPTLTPTFAGSTEEYDGSTWTSNPTGLNTAREFLAGAGIQTAALAFGGNLPGNSSATEEYDGSTWTSYYKYRQQQDI